MAMRHIASNSVEMAIIGDALRQAFMAKHDYESLLEEDKAWHKMQRPLIVLALALISLAISETADYYWTVMFLPSSMLFAVYLIADESDSGG
ncbi:hypothetical protein AAHA92_13217 [Salvia divinorum]|uniref:Uncharacterized protein n=1 Tax=Salvia divinorum TaxID=28513 RepID=A0ABD1H7M5_SALDI